MSLEQIAKQIYRNETNNHPTIHSNRFPSWDELSLHEKKKYLKEAEKWLI